MPKTLTKVTMRDSQESSYERFKSLSSPIRICGHCHFLSTSEEARSHVCFKTSNPPREDEDEIEFKQNRLSSDDTSERNNTVKLISAIIVVGVVVATLCQFKFDQKSEFEIKRQAEACNATLPAQSDTPTNGVVGLF